MVIPAPTTIEYRAICAHLAAERPAMGLADPLLQKTMADQWPISDKRITFRDQALSEIQLRGFIPGRPAIRGFGFPDLPIAILEHCKSDQDHGQDRDQRFFGFEKGKNFIFHHYSFRM
jgi:hypothetical protein